MTMSKYYICNDIKFINGMGAGVSSPTSATHYKKGKAASFIKTHKGYTSYKARSSSKKENDYVICSQMKFVGQDGGVIDDMKRAKEFSSIDEAYEYLDANRESMDKDLIFVIDEKFSRKKRQKPPVIVERVEMFNFDNMDTSERIIIPKDVRQHVYRKSNGICCICGKPLGDGYNIDHIIPLSREGTNAVENLRAVHPTCNRFKGMFTDEELTKMSADVVCRNIFTNPSSNLTAMIMRSFIRGVNRSYSNRN